MGENPLRKHEKESAEKGHDRSRILEEHPHGNRWFMTFFFLVMTCFRRKMMARILKITIKTAVMERTVTSFVLLETIPLKAGPTTAASPTNAPERANLFLFSLSRQNSLNK